MKITEDTPLRGTFDAHATRGVAHWAVLKNNKASKFKYIACTGSGKLVDSWKKAIYNGGYCIRVHKDNDPEVLGYFVVTELIGVDWLDNMSVEMRS